MLRAGLLRVLEKLKRAVLHPTLLEAVKFIELDSTDLYKKVITPGMDKWKIAKTTQVKIGQTKEASMTNDDITDITKEKFKDFKVNEVKRNFTAAQNFDALAIELKDLE